jgi:hypothetical protein
MVLVENDDSLKGRISNSGTDPCSKGGRDLPDKDFQD